MIKGRLSMKKYSKLKVKTYLKTLLREECEEYNYVS